MSNELEFPKPRKGFLGEWDKFIGPGANKVENILILSVAFLSGIAMLLFSLFGNLQWDIARIILAVVIATDLGGGVVANATSPAKRWYHREERKLWNHMLFSAFHIYPFIIGLLFRELDWIYSGVVYGYLLLASLIVLLVPLYIQRPVSFILFMGAIFLNWYAFSPTPGLEWFIPVLFLKIVVGHIVKEEPYRPVKRERKI